jgi:hypothetical protein
MLKAQIPLKASNCFAMHWLRVAGIFKESVLQKTARNFSPIILSHNLGTSKIIKTFEGPGDSSKDMN